MKDFIEVLFKLGITPIVYAVGIATIGLFIVSRIPEYAWISKFAVLFAMTH